VSRKEVAERAEGPWRVFDIWVQFERG